MALDLNEWLVPKRGPATVAFRAVLVADERYVLVSCDQPEPYSTLLVRSLGDIEEEFRNVPERRTLDRWANVNNDGTCGMYVSRRLADEFACSDRIACVHIQQDYEVGEGLS